MSKQRELDLAIADLVEASVRVGRLLAESERPMSALCVYNTAYEVSAHQSDIRRAEGNRAYLAAKAGELTK